jgi:DNA-binding beta-propeller fold protein YncE
VVNDRFTRRAFALGGAGALAGLAGCAADEGQVRRVRPEQPSGLLRPWLSISGGWRLDTASPLQLARPTGARVNLVQPVGVVARNEIVMIADAGARVIWRFDRTRDSLTPFADFTGWVPEAGSSMQLGNDFSLWVALPAQHHVVQYDLRGKAVRRWASALDAPRPVSVVVPEDRSEVVVGDIATARIVVFDPLGQPREILGGPRASALESVSAMALGPAGLYVLDRLAQQVVVLDRRGLPVQVIGEHQLVQPRALAVDASGRVFVSDEMEQRIKVFRGDQLLASFGGKGNAPGRFGRIESMALDGNLLYVADSVNARVDVLLVAPPSMETWTPPR